MNLIGLTSGSLLHESAHDFVSYSAKGRLRKRERSRFVKSEKPRKRRKRKRSEGRRKSTRETRLSTIRKMNLPRIES